VDQSLVFTAAAVENHEVIIFLETQDGFHIPAIFIPKVADGTDL
jgi:hypothetical protein